MYVLYVDESGCVGSLPAGKSSIQPVLCVVGLIVPQSNVSHLTRQWIDLKKRHFPRLLQHTAKIHDWHLAEIKGSDIRRGFRQGARKRDLRHATGFLDRALDLLEFNDCRYCARVWIKVPGANFNGRSVYTVSVQDLCKSFEYKLSKHDVLGLVIADSRNPHLNAIVSHSVFTQKYQAAGDLFPSVVETPVFGHSHNHAGLQLADILASALLFPLCAQFYQDGRIESIHLDVGYDQIGRRYGQRLRGLQYRHMHASNGRGLAGGLVVSDRHGRLGAGHLFSKYCSPVSAVTITAPPSVTTARPVIVSTLTPPTKPSPKLI
ncbi:MAG: DUF3800 domain-containing protein [Phycisphaerales bacterium]|nr:DUF3800 domain-containing protein [Phycisphaerales bacterium]